MVDLDYQVRAVQDYVQNTDIGDARTTLHGEQQRLVLQAGDEIGLEKVDVEEALALLLGVGDALLDLLAPRQAARSPL